MTLSLKAAQDIAGSIGFPSKMPGTSYGIPAQHCLTGGKLVNVAGSVCEGCYAFHGNYQYPSVEQGQAKRFAGLTHEQWVNAMVRMITHIHKTGMGRNGPIQVGHHRWHDAGDLQSEQHFANICAVAAATPHIEHWLPTRELAIVLRYIANGGIVPSNLCVRVSDTMIDGNPTRAWPITSGVTKRQWFSPLGDDTPITNICPAPDQDGECKDCRLCWDKTVERTTYRFHN